MKNQIINNQTELNDLLNNLPKVFSVTHEKGVMVCKGIESRGSQNVIFIPFNKDVKKLDLTVNEIKGLKIKGIYYENKVYIPEIMKNPKIEKPDIFSKPAIHIEEVKVAKGLVTKTKDGFVGRIVRYMSNVEITLHNEETGEKRIVCKSDLICNYAINYWG